MHTDKHKWLLISWYIVNITDGSDVSLYHEMVGKLCIATVYTSVTIIILYLVLYTSVWSYESVMYYIGIIHHIHKTQ